MLLLIGIGINRYKNILRLNDKFAQNIEADSHNSDLWRNNYGQLVISSNAKLLTLKEAKTTSDSIVTKLLNENTRLGNKLSRTEYLLGLQTNMNIDTIVKVTTITINDTLFKYIDSLKISSFELTRVQLSNSDTASYHIEYHPKIYLSINWYKLGKWKLKNICKPRLRVYKVDMKVNDDILKPSQLDVIKFSKI